MTTGVVENGVNPAFMFVYEQKVGCGSETGTFTDGAIRHWNAIAIHILRSRKFIQHSSAAIHPIAG